MPADPTRRSHSWRKVATVPAAMVISLFLFTSLFLLMTRQSAAAPAGNNPPTIMKCQGGARTQVVISWNDRDTDETGYRIERSIAGAAFKEYAILGANATQFFDLGIDVTKNHRYRVRAAHSDGTFTDYGPICNNRHIVETRAMTDTAGFRIFYGIQGTDDCPLFEKQRVCVTNTTTATTTANTAGDSNPFITRQAAALEGSVAAFGRVGFDRDAAIPDRGSKIPVNVIWCDSGGCASGTSLAIAPALIETNFNTATRAGDPIAYLVPEHESFHFQQYKYNGLVDPDRDWVLEGQARSSQDKICIGADRAEALCFDDIATGMFGYVPEVNGYLGNPSISINRASYRSALFWTYLTEKYGTAPVSDSVEAGMNLMVEFWKEVDAHPDRDGIAVLDSTLAKLGHGARFRDVWKDFAVANYAKNLSGAGVPDKYKYADMAEPGGAYLPVKQTVTQTVAVGQQFQGASDSIEAWAAKYYVFLPAANVPVLDLYVDQVGSSPLYYTVLGIKANGIQHEYNFEGLNLRHSVFNDGYDRVVVIVAGLERSANYTLKVKGIRSTLNILAPTTDTKARVGDPAAPDKLRVAVQLLDTDAAQLAGVDLADFRFRIGDRDVPADNILTAALVQGQQWFVLRAPAQTTAGQYDLQVSYGGTTVLSATQQSAVDYTPRINADSLLIIDRSGSMSGPKLQAAQNAAKLYVDSWRPGDKLGVVSFNDTPVTAMQLVTWTTAPAGGSRQAAFTAIDNLTATLGTNIGDSLIMGFNELQARGDNGHDWALVLLSDGKEEASHPTVPFGNAINTIRDAAGKKAVIHAVAIGPDADGEKMQRAALETGGTYQFVAAPPTVLAPDTAEANALANPRLDLDARYRTIASEILGQQPFFTLVGPIEDGIGEQDVVTIPVEGSVAEWVLALSFDGVCVCDAELKDPNGGVIPITQQTNRHVVWRLPTPEPGAWVLTIRLIPALVSVAEEPFEEQLTPYLVQAAVSSDLTLDLYTPVPVAERTSGAPMPIIAALTESGPIVAATVSATIQGPAGAIDKLRLFDDGLHADGKANDGLYGNTFYKTGLAGDTAGTGSYNVSVDAHGTSTLAGLFVRQKVFSFFIFSRGDQDGDGLPDEYEERHGGSPTTLNPNDDDDQDGSTNKQEFDNGTNPKSADTDNGGEADGSESGRGSNPTDPADDAVKPTWTVAYPGDAKVFVRYAPRATYAAVQIYRSQTLTGVFTLVGEDMSGSGIFSDTDVINHRHYCYIAIGRTAGGARSAPLTPDCTIPKEDPWKPDGAMLINNGASTTPVPTVTLTLFASDQVELHADTPDNLDNIMLPPANSATGVVEMRISNDAAMGAAPWQSFAASKQWRLGQSQGLTMVYAQFRDGAGNESRIVPNAIWIVEGSGFAALSVDKSASVATAKPGDMVVYTYRITNIGDVALNDLSALDDKLGKIALSMTTLTPGQFVTGTAGYTVKEADLPDPITNTVTVTASGANGQPAHGSDTASVALEQGPSPDEKNYLPTLGK